ncbi:MAG: hypothetical protein IPP73_17500 [Chitinophagaceae bacterium]|nr:hypothetical protein [Chitinophagaceae bacterium]
MNKHSFSRKLVMFAVVFFVFLQPSIQCSNHDKSNAGIKSSNPIYALDKDAGIQWEASAPDEILASEVKMQPGVVEVPDAEMNYLEKADQQGGEYVFAGDASGVAKLQPGSFVFFRNHSVRKILSTESKDGKVVVQTEKCKFTDVFSDAHLHFKEHYDWKDNSAAILNHFSLSFGNVAMAQGGGGGGLSQNLSWEGDLANYHVKIKLQPEGGRKLNYEINMRRQSSANITFKGYISDYDNETELTVANSELQLFRSQNQNLHGEVEVLFAAVNLGEDGELINIPWTMFERPILIGGIPFVFKTKANVKVFPYIQENESSQGNFKFTYDSNIGFQYSGNAVNAEGDVTSNTMEVVGETLSASMMGNGIGMGVEFPRFEIASLGEIVVPYFLMNTAVDTQVDTYAPCQMGNMRCKLVAGLSLSFFGASWNAERELWHANKRWERPGGHCPPEEE